MTLRRRLCLLSVAVPVVLVAIVAFAAIQLFQARTHLERGAAYMAPATDELRSAAIIRSPSRRKALRLSIGRAHAEFTAARSNLRLWAPILQRVGWLPGVGTELHAAPFLADAAVHTTSAAEDLFAGLDPIWSRVNSTRGRPDLPFLVTSLREGQANFRRVGDDSAAALAALQHVPRRTGLTSVDRETPQLRSGLHALHGAAVWLRVAPTLLGARHPSTFLLAWQDPREIRATGGFIGAANFIRVNRGRSTVLPGSTVVFPHERNIPLPLPEAAYTNEGNFLFRDANFSPDFPLSARMERWIYGEDTGRWATTVVDIDPAAAVDILRTVGPISIPGIGTRVGVANAVSIADRAINHTAAANDEQRKRFFGTFMHAFLGRIQRLPLERWPALARGVSVAIAKGDILLYDRRPDIEAAIRHAGAAGSLIRSSGDSLFIVDDNRSYNKLGPYIDERARYDATIAPDLSVHARLALTYHVAPSPDSLEGAGPGYGLLGTKHDFQDFIRVYVPAGAVLEQMTGADLWKPQQAYGVTQFAGHILVREGQTVHVSMRYRLPANIFAPDGFTRYRLTIQRQTGTRLHVVQVHLRGAPGVTVDGRPDGASYRTIQLSKRQASLTVPISSHSAPRLIEIHHSMRRDPYVPYAGMRDPRHPL